MGFIVNLLHILNIRKYPMQIILLSYEFYLHIH